MTETQIKAFGQFTADFNKSTTVFNNGCIGTTLLGTRLWLEYYDAKQTAYAKLIEVIPAIKNIDGFWRMVQTRPAAAWLASVTSDLRRIEQDRVCLDCATKISGGQRCESCAAAKREADKAKRKAGRKLKRRIKQLKK